MAPKTLDQLRREKNQLLKMNAGRLRGVRAKQSLDNLAKAKRLEAKKLRAEIKALKNPGSIEARKQFKSAAGKFGQLVKNGAIKINENLERQAAEEERLERIARAKRKTPAKRKSNSKKPVKRGSTSSRVIRRR